MEKFYINLELDIEDIEKIIFKYKNKIIIIINKKETCPAKNTSCK